MLNLENAPRDAPLLFYSMMSDHWIEAIVNVGNGYVHDSAINWLWDHAPNLGLSSNNFIKSASFANAK